MNQDSPGDKKLIASIEHDEKSSDKSTHRYREKLAWIIARAEHYAEKTQVTPEYVLNAWEERRSYWYMNYYQDSKQPLIEGDSIRIFENVDEIRAMFAGTKFRCPACDGESSSPYECDSGVMVKSDRKNMMMKCDWKSFGLFGTLGKGVTIVCKDPYVIESIFKPIAWETQPEPALVPSVP